MFEYSKARQQDSVHHVDDLLRENKSGYFASKVSALNGWLNTVSDTLQQPG
jgi:hypothetical protein